MRRISVRIPDEIHSLLNGEAERRGTSASVIAREAITVYLLARDRRRLYAAKAGRSGITDISERAEEIVRSEAGSPLPAPAAHPIM